MTAAADARAAVLERYSDARLGHLRRARDPRHRESPADTAWHHRAARLLRRAADAERNERTAEQVLDDARRVFLEDGP